MGLISIGSHTFLRNPASMDPLEPVRFNSYVMTYSSVSHFSWGFDIVGKEIVLIWPYMTNTEYEQIRTIHLEDTVQILTPNDGSGASFNVQMMDFNGKYYKGRGTDQTASRLDVRLALLIISQN